MKVEIEGRRVDTTRGALLQMARREEIQPWFFIKSKELTGGKWVKAGELQFFAGAWGDREKAAAKVRASRLPVPTARISRQKLVHSPRKGGPPVRGSKLTAETAVAPVGAAGSAFFDLHGFRVNYRVSCPKCSSSLTKLGVPNCPRCSAKLAATKQVYWLKRVLYAACMIALFGSTFILDALGEWAKFLYPATAVLLSLMSVIARGAKVLVAISVKGHSMPPKEIVIPLGEYYSPNVWNKVAERVKSVFKLNAVLRKMRQDESLRAPGGTARQRL